MWYTYQICKLDMQFLDLWKDARDSKLSIVPLDGYTEWSTTRIEIRPIHVNTVCQWTATLDFQHLMNVYWRYKTLGIDLPIKGWLRLTSTSWWASRMVKQLAPETDSRQVQNYAQKSLIFWRIGLCRWLVYSINSSKRPTLVRYGRLQLLQQIKYKYLMLTPSSVQNRVQAHNDVSNA